MTTRRELRIAKIFPGPRHRSAAGGEGRGEGDRKMAHLCKCSCPPTLRNKTKKLYIYKISRIKVARTDQHALRSEKKALLWACCCVLNPPSSSSPSCASSWRGHPPLALTVVGPRNLLPSSSSSSSSRSSPTCHSLTTLSCDTLSATSCSRAQGRASRSVVGKVLAHHAYRLVRQDAYDPDQTVRGAGEEGVLIHLGHGVHASWVARNLSLQSFQ